MNLNTSAVRNRSLHVETYGSPGANLVFIPGLAGTTRYWRGRLGGLANEHHIVLVDPLGFGDSPKPWTRYSIEKHIGALDQVLEKDAGFTLVGHSMGALLALAFAARNPERVQALILLSLPYYGSRKNAVHTVRLSSVFNRLFLGNMLLAASICLVTRRIFGWLAPYLPLDVPPEVAADIVKHSWRSFTSSLWVVVYKYDARPDVSALSDRIPVLCIHGDPDKAAPLEGVKILAGRHPNWQVRVLPGIGHHPFLNAKDGTINAIRAFLLQKVSLSEQPRTGGKKT